MSRPVLLFSAALLAALPAFRPYPTQLQRRVDLKVAIDS